MKTSRLLMLLCASWLSIACSTPTNRATEAPSAAADASSAVGEAGAPDSTAVPVAVAGAEDRRVCKKIAPTGSRIAQRICKPASEWEAMQRNAREATDTFQRSGAAQSTTSE